MTSVKQSLNLGTDCTTKCSTRRAPLTHRTEQHHVILYYRPLNHSYRLSGNSRGKDGTREGYNGGLIPNRSFKTYVQALQTPQRIEKLHKMYRDLFKRMCLTCNTEWLLQGIWKEAGRRMRQQADNHERSYKRRSDAVAIDVSGWSAFDFEPLPTQSFC